DRRGRRHGRGAGGDEDGAADHRPQGRDDHRPGRRGRPDRLLRRGHLRDQGQLSRRPAPARVAGGGGFPAATSAGSAAWGTPTTGTGHKSPCRMKRNRPPHGQTGGMSTEIRAIRAARRGAVSAIIAAVALPAFAFTAPAQAATGPPETTQSAAAHTTTAQTVALTPAAPAAAADTVGQIANGLLDSRLYVTGEAGNVLSEADRNEIETALGGASDADIRAVVVSNDVTGVQVGQMLKSVASRVGEGETYVAVTADGTRMNGISKKLSSQELNQIVTRTNGAPLKDRLVRFADLAENKVDENSRSSAIGGFV